MSTSRIEAFSDGVFAIAITLLVLEIGVPEPSKETSLGHELLHQWPEYASYVVSFFTIGVIWINHHAMFDHLLRADRNVLFLNLLLLLWIGLLPWPTNVLAQYMTEGGADERVAAVLYTGVMTLMGVSFGALWTYCTRHRELLDESL